MNFLLDTSVVIDIESLDVGNADADVLYVSAVTIGELAQGLDTRDPSVLAGRSERYYWTLAECEVLPFDLAAAKTYGILCARVRQAGRNPRPRRLDLQIAATAAVNGLPLLTRNPDDFKGTERHVDVIAI